MDSHSLLRYKSYFITTFVDFITNLSYAYFSVSKFSELLVTFYEDRSQGGNELSYLMIL